MTQLNDMTPAQVRELNTDELVEAIAQMLYNRAENASDAEDEAITQPIKQLYREKYLTYCGAAEHVRNVLRA